MTRDRLVARAQRAIDQGGDTRYMKKELKAGNVYLEAWLARRGLVWDAEMGAIVRRELWLGPRP